MSPDWTARRVAVTGSGGRVGSALVAELHRAGAELIEWVRPDLDLDDPRSVARLVARDQPDLVFHAAAWTDVDACAREPERAMRRNGLATAELAGACAAAATDLVFLSTNEVFNGDRSEGGYAEDDPIDPPNAYGRSKAAGEDAVRSAFASEPAKAWIVRTSWIFGPPGNDFPTRITTAADARKGEPLGVVADEFGRPTFAADLAESLVRLLAIAPSGIYHLANEGVGSRYDWAREILARCRPDVTIEAISLADFKRHSVPPRWGVLDTSRAAALGVSMRPWQESLAAYLAEICPDR